MKTSLITAAVLFVLSTVTGCASSGSLAQPRDAAESTFATRPSGGYAAPQVEGQRAATNNQSPKQPRAAGASPAAGARTERPSRPNPEHRVNRPNPERHMSRPADRSRFSSSR